MRHSGAQDETASAPVTTQKKAQPSIGRSTALFSGATLVSRITGFVRNWAMAFALGNTMLSTTYYIANNLPNQLYSLVSGGMLTAAFLPIYVAQLKKKGVRGSASYASNLLSIAVVVLGLVALLATFFAPQVMFTQTFVQGSDFDLSKAVFFFRFFAVQVVFYGVGAIIGGMLNAHRSYLWPAMGPVFNNIVVIVTFFGYPAISAANELVGSIWLAAGTTLGVVAMFAVQIPALVRLKLPLRFHIDFHDKALRDTVRMALPASVYVIANLVVMSCLNAFSLGISQIGPSTMSYAMVWYQLPYGVIGVALSTTLFTEMSEASAVGDWPTFRRHVRDGLRTTVFLILPLAALMLALATHLAGLYHAGQFTYSDVLSVGQVLAFWCLSLPFYAAYNYLYRVFSALRDLRRYVVVDLCGRVVQIALYVVLTKGVGGWGGIGLVGIPLADAITYVLLLGVMCLVLRRQIGPFGFGGIVASGVKVLVASVLAALIPGLVAAAVPGSNIGISLAVIVICGVGGLVLFYLFARVLRVPEVKLVDHILLRLRHALHRHTHGDKNAG
jgi:putative peptidoglycan lipid II flippase